MGAGAFRKHPAASYELPHKLVDGPPLLDPRLYPSYPRVSSPNSPSVAELKGRLLELGLHMPPNAVEKSELIAMIDLGEKQRAQVHLDDATRTPNSSPDLRSPSSASTPKRSVSELKSRLKELGFRVPTSIMEKGELLALVEEAERQALRRNVGAPTAPRTSTAVFALRSRLADLGVKVPAGHVEESELRALLKEAEVKEPVKIERTVADDITLTCMLGSQGVAKIETANLNRQFTQDSDNAWRTTESLVVGSMFKWIKGECIGYGASGAVYKALNQTTGQMMAVKEVIMDLQRQSDAKFKAALENEITLMRELRHPNIVAYYGCDSIGSSIFMYLEYMAAGSVARVLDQFGTFEESLIADYTQQLLNGLEYLHTQNPYVVHRDIKGANILLGIESTVKLADFGCSKREQETMSLTMGGSIPWMAPEVIAHARYGRAGDIWSFGCLMIEMATAETPWGNFDNLMAAMIKIGMSTEMPAIPDTLSPLCRAFIRRCLNRDPGRRLSASELLNEKFLRLVGPDEEELLHESTDEFMMGSHASPSQDEDSLPKGWEMHFDATYGEWYYWHRPTGRSTWERPSGNLADDEDSTSDSGLLD